MSAAPVEDSSKPMHDRGTAQEVNEVTDKTPAPSTKGDAATQQTDSADGAKGVKADDDDDRDGSGDKKKKDEDEVPAEQKVKKGTYVVHSDLKDELDRKMENVPEKDIGVVNEAKLQEQAEKAEAEDSDGKAGEDLSNHCGDTRLIETHSERRRQNRPYGYSRCRTEGERRRQGQAPASQEVKRESTLTLETNLPVYPTAVRR